MNIPLRVSLAAFLFFSSVCVAEKENHLFILSGQSNMARLDPGVSFTPTVASAFGIDHVTVVKDAQGGQPIRRWYKAWAPVQGGAPKAPGDLYDRLMKKVDAAAVGKVFDTVTFVWMQGERDAREQHGEVYAASLKGLRAQLAEDLGRQDINFVIGRLSDYDMANQRYPHWTMIREAQVEVASGDPHAAWVDTDDLNDGLNAKGEAIHKDLHYSVSGYATFGKRLAEASIRLIKLRAGRSMPEVSTTTYEADVCVYGGTASGVMAAIAAAREGAEVIIVEPSRWLGGMTGGGIDHLDWGRDEAVGGSTFSFLTGGLDDVDSRKPVYGGTYSETTRIGSSNAEYRQRFEALTAQYGIQVIYDHRLGQVLSDDASIRSIVLDLAPVDETGCPISEPVKSGAATVTAGVFIDCSYEGDLMAMSGVSYTWGRESREQYGESLAGVRPSLWEYEIDPYVEPGNPESGLIPFVQDREIGPLGSADQLTMGYCFRFKFDRSGQGLPIPEPENYDPAEFAMFRRAFENDVDIFTARHMTQPGKITEVPGRLFFTTNLHRALWSNTIYGKNADYPDGDWAVRSRFWKFQQQFISKLIHFAKSDPSVPAELKERAENLTFTRGEFDDTAGWPHQLYVREARRMVADYVVTEHDVAGKTDPPNSIGLASYGVDDWPYATVVEDGKIALQGGEFSILYFEDNPHDGIYKIPYGAIVPKAGECDNLLVPVCLSASHIAMTSIRMEPVWMILGESAGVAAAMAVQSDKAVQDVPYDQLRARLLELEQRLDRPEIQ